MRLQEQEGFDAAIQALQLQKGEGNGRTIMTGGAGDGSYRPERWHGDAVGDGEPDPAVSDEVLRGADEERGPEREHGAERAGEEADAVAQILGDAEAGHLALVVAQRGLDRRRQAAEQVSHPGDRLHPHRRHEHQPPVPQEPPHPAPHLRHCLQHLSQNSNPNQHTRTRIRSEQQPREANARS